MKTVKNPSVVGCNKKRVNCYVMGVNCNGQPNTKGTLVNYLGMRRVNTRGLQQANKCMLMAAVAYNLKKLLRWQGKKANTAIKALQKPLQNAFLKLSGLSDAIAVYVN